MECLRRLIQIGFVPVFALGPGGLAVAGISAGWGWPPLIVLVLAAIVTSYGAERVFPYQERWNDSRGDTGRDVLHAIVNEGSALASVSLPPVLAVFLDGLALAPWPVEWPFALQVVAAILVFDLGVTFAHYASHRLETLWRFHAVHHTGRVGGSDGRTVPRSRPEGRTPVSPGASSWSISLGSTATTRASRRVAAS